VDVDRGVPVEIGVTVVGARAGEDARALRHWLADEQDLRGRVRLVEQSPEPGSLGAAVDTLLVGLGSSGAVTAFAAGLVSWIRHRTGDTRAVVRRPDGSEIEVAAERVRNLDMAGVRALVEDLSRMAGGNGTG
jgi:Effector Associated Constant Component 1